MDVAKSPSNPYTNPRPTVFCYRTNSSKYSFSEQDEVSDKIGYSYYHITLYPVYSVVFHGSKSNIGINYSKDYLKHPSTLLNG